MITTGFQITETLQLAPFPLEGREPFDLADDAAVWLDMRDFEPDELRERLETLGVEGLAQRICLEAGNHPGFYPLRNSILLVLPMLTGKVLSEDVGHLAILCRKNLLLTFHRERIPLLEADVSFQHADAWLPERSIAGLVCGILLNISQDCQLQISQLRQLILALDDRMELDPDTVDAADITNLRSKLLTVGSVVGDQVPCLEAFAATDSSFLKLQGSTGFLTSTVANQQAACRALEWLDQRLTALRANLQMLGQERMNRRLGLLSILSAVLMPSTLLAGIWGMNFELMPEMKLPFGYPLALALMASIGFGLYFFFRRKGWFD